MNVLRPIAVRLPRAPTIADAVVLEDLSAQVLGPDTPSSFDAVTVLQPEDFTSATGKIASGLPEGSIIIEAPTQTAAVLMVAYVRAKDQPSLNTDEAILALIRAHTSLLSPPA